MTNEQFKSLGQEIYGKSGWQKQLAAGLRMNAVTISRYATGALPVPPVVQVAMQGLRAAK